MTGAAGAVGSLDGSGWLAALEAAPPIAALRESTWAYPAVETAHLLGIVAAIGATVIFDLRLLGAGRSLPADRLARLLRPAVVAGLALLVPSGLLLFATEAPTHWASPIFRTKLLLLAAGAANALLFHLTAWRAVAAWRDGPTPLPARLSGAFSLVVWASVIACGRWIAYW
jgi:hypothetical protein